MTLALEITMPTTERLLLAAGVFGVVLSLWLIGLLLWSMRQTTRSRQMAQRLGEFDPAGEPVRVLRLWHEGEEATTVVPADSWLNRRLHQLRHLPEDAGWDMPLRSMVMGLAGAMLLGAVLTYAFSHLLIPSLGVAVAIFAGFVIFAKYRIAKHEARFERQFAEALNLLARSLRAGHPLTGAFRLASEEMQPPVSHIFARICQEQSLGVDLERSLRDSAEQSNSPDLKLFATSVAIQLKTGGNLADMMDRLAQVIRARIRLSQRVRIVSAQTQLSKRILLALPLVMLLGLSILNPAHMDALWQTSMGHKMLIAGGIAMLLGWVTMNRMARIKY